MTYSSVLLDCPLCGKIGGKARYRESDWVVASCDGCGLLITWPRPAEEHDLYADENYYESRDMGGGAEEAWRYRAVGLLNQLGYVPKRALDIGAGAGHLVHSLQRLGIEGRGVEPSAAGRRLAQRLYGLSLLPDVPDESTGTFDLITLIHSLEHVPDPLRLLRATGRLLSLDGRVLLEVPHAGSVEMLRPGRRRHILDLPAHLYHFVPSTLRALVESAGLQVLDVSLSNSDIVEWALSLRARLRGSSAPVPSPLPEARSRMNPVASPASLWRRRALPWLRRVMPGWQFRITAVRGGEAERR